MMSYQTKRKNNMKIIATIIENNVGILGVFMSGITNYCTFPIKFNTGRNTSTPINC